MKEEVEEMMSEDDVAGWFLVHSKRLSFAAFVSLSPKTFLPKLRRGPSVGSKAVRGEDRR